MRRFRPEISQAASLLDIGTRRIFSEEHDIFRENVRRFFTDELAPHQDRWEKQGHVDKDIFWKKLGQQGYLGIDLPVELGGIGGDFISSTIVLEEQMFLGYIGASLYVHNEVVIPYISTYGTPEQKEKYLPRLVSGDIVGAVAMTEPSAGSDLQGIKTYAKKEGDDWILNGSKVFISNGYLSDLVIVAAITDLESNKKAHGMSLFLVDAGTPGFNKGRILEKIGEKSSDAAELFFEDVRLPSSAILGGETGINKGFYRLMEQLPRERLTIGLGALSLAEAVFEMTRDYVKKRKAFGKTLSKLQTVQHRLAELKTEICVNRAFLDQGTQMYQEGRLDNVTASMIKCSTTDMVVKVCDEGVQLHGGWGYMWEYPVARAFCAARVMTIYGGTNEIMRELIARDIVRDK
ncbi:putative long-chain specific acyl-CoA dehydrogenase, mitochondrial isoform X2 [Apostichopus japonicus]|uniref:Putative long-chain specific acyl-CoA dehydrogenase, mitochondrial isoform X2 n=1 Tax=Stichopus japonicus TaxID=307972 RepID=A0A2G8JKB5_STIJA|nr:putative long-chain specific acyl-CoA dehydrogenase, mitochondrial isoform X2 [Apostichopus japonicus]